MANLVREVMQPGLVSVDAGASIEAAAGAMRENDIGDVVVVDGDQVRGILTDRDIVVRAVAEHKPLTATSAGECCSPDILGVGPEDTTDEAISLMRQHAVRRLPVVSDGRLIGVVSIGDLAISEDPRSALADISRASPNT